MVPYGHPAPSNGPPIVRSLAPPYELLVANSLHRMPIVTGRSRPRGSDRHDFDVWHDGSNGPRLSLTRLRLRGYAYAPAPYGYGRSGDGNDIDQIVLGYVPYPNECYSDDSYGRFVPCDQS
jgi:hypothetical protein